MSGLDHGMLNLPIGHRGRGKSIDATINAAVKQIAADKAAAEREQRIARKAARYAEAVRPKLTREDCEGARFVRDQFGWHKVVRISAKSVTVATEYSWTDRLPFAKVLEVRS